MYRSAEQPYHHGNVKNDLVSTAMRLMEDEDIEKLSLRRLAREIGVTPAAVYNHFGSKQELMAAVKTKAYDEMQNFFRSNCTSHKEPEDAFEEICQVYVNFSHQHSTLFDILFTEKAPLDIPPKTLSDSPERKPNFFASILRALYAKYEIAVTEDRLAGSCMLIWAQLHGLIVLRDSGSIAIARSNYNESLSGPADDCIILENLIKQMSDGLFRSLSFQQAALKSARKI